MSDRRPRLGPSAWYRLAAGFCLALALAGSAEAQTRPTFSELESELATLQADHAALEAEHARTLDAVCAKADFDGDSYRPYACDPRCDCFGPVVGSWQLDACSETASGEFALSATVPSRDALCEGICMSVSGQTAGVCQTQSECPSPFECTYFDLEFNLVASCVDSVLACNADEDCAPGYTCSAGRCGSPGSTCTAPPTTTPSVCDTLPPTVLELVTLSGVAAADSPAGVDCSVTFPGAPQITSAINSNDALQCLADVEAAIGAACAYLCGDGELDPGEQCDDGNAAPGDGCDASCQLEP